jgi:hypothetical protein
LAAALTGGWAMFAIGLPAQAISISAEDPAPDEPAADEPAADEPAADEPAADEPAADEPAADEPAADEPAADESTDEELTDEEPTDEEPTDEEPTDEEPTDEEPTDEEPTDEELTDETTEEAVDEAVDETSEETTEEAVDETTEEAVDETTEELVDEPVDEATDEPATTTPAQVSISIDAELGASAGGAGVSVKASGLLPSSRATLFIFSTPQLIGEAIADADGSLSMSAVLPSDLPAGDHTLVLEAVDSAGNPIQQATGVGLSADGTIASKTDNASTAGLKIPVISSNPKVPAYPLVVPLEAPAAVVATSIAALTVATVASVGLAGSGRESSPGAPGGPSGDGIDTAVRGSTAELAELDELHVANLQGRAGAALALSGVGAVVAKFSPLLSRTFTDAAPLRAFTGSFSLLLPLAALLLGIFAAVSVGGRAEPAVLAFMIPLLVLGVFDALAGLIGSVAFAVVVALSGGIVDASSVRTLLGVGLIVVGPGLIAASFRDIRRRRTSGSAATWERLTDLVVVPLIGAWTTIAIVQALPTLGALDFPIAEQARLLGLVALISLLLKVLLEEAAARKVPGRMRALSPANLPDPSTTQQVISAFVRTGAFLFIAAAFVGNVWQLWVAALLFLLPGLLALLAHRFKNSPALWQVIPDGVPLFVIMLAFGLLVSVILGNALGEVPEFAQMQFLLMAVPGFLLALLGLVAREPKAGDTRWYTRPTMTMVYRVGGVLMLIAACVLGVQA